MKKVKQNKMTEEKVSRRSFLKTAAVTAGAAATMGFPTMVAQAQPNVIHWKGQNEYTQVDFPVPGIKVKGGMGSSGTGLAKWIKDVTNGRLLIDLGPPGSICPPSEGLKAVGRGAVDMISLTLGSLWTGTIPEANFEPGPPYAWLSVPEIYEFMYLRGGYDIIHEAYLKHNVYWIPNPIGGPYCILSKSKLSSVKDLKGKRIRSSGLIADLFKEFGASPTVIPASEIYMALKLGTIDATYNVPSMLKESKLEEVVSYCVYSPVPTGGFGCTLINLDKWKALPPDIREFLDQNIKYFNLSTLLTIDTFSWISLWSAQKVAGVQPIAWPDSDLPLIMEKVVASWEKMGAANANCAKLLEILKGQARDRNRIK